MIIILAGRTIIICIELYLFKEKPQCVEKTISRDVSDVWVAFVCVFAHSVSENDAITSSTACLICWPFILSGLLLRPLYVLLPKQRPFRTLPHTLPLTKCTFHLACSLQCCLNDSRVVSMATNPCPYKALWRFSTTHPLPSSSVSPSLSHTFIPPPHELCWIHLI